MHRRDVRDRQLGERHSGLVHLVMTNPGVPEVETSHDRVDRLNPRQPSGMQERADDAGVAARIKNDQAQVPHVDDQR